MVKKNLIEKIFNESIKSHQHLTIQNNKIISVFDNFHDKYCGEKPRKSEVSEWTDADGNSVFFKKGKKDKVEFTEKEIKEKYNEYGELHVTHNHPRGNIRPPCECLSPDDIYTLFTKFHNYDKGGKLINSYHPFKSISAESSNGTRMTLVRGDKFNKEKDMEKIHKADKILQDYFESYYHSYYQTSNKIRNETNINDFTDSKEYESYLHESTIKKVGEFEKNTEFKKAQKLFREGNCRLSVSHPYEYKVGFWK